MKELETIKGWVSCPKDEIAYAIYLHCNPELNKCPYYSHLGVGKMYCKYEEEKESNEESCCDPNQQ